MKNNKVLVQHSDESSLKAYHGHMRDNFARGLELLVHFQIGLEFRVIGGSFHVASFDGSSW